MRQVSCRALGVILKAAKRRKVDERVLTAGTSYDLAYLRDPKHRIEWEAFCHILRNARGVWTLEEMSDLNESFMRSPFFSSVGVIARVLFTARDLFAWMQKRSVGGGAQLFSDCVKPSYEHVGSDVTIIRLEIVEPYEPSSEFFWMTRGAFVGIPRLVGAGSADVAMQIDGRTGTFRVRYKNKRGTLSSLIRMLRWPMTIRAVARELQASNEELQARYYELEEARSKIDRQATQLHTAHVVNQLVQRDLDLAHTLETIVKALVEIAGFAGAEIVFEDGQRARYGDDESEPPIVIVLETHGGNPLGKLTAMPKRGADRRERDELLAFVTPSLAMALENASYRTNLERQVDARTAELRQARDELAGTVDQLREAQGARQRFFGHISHEIRTPLTIITLAASDVAYRAGDVLDKRSRRNLDAVNDAARKLVRLVDELLLLAAGQEGKLTTNPEPTDVAEMLRHIEAAWHLAVESAGLTIATRIPATLVMNVDPVAIERVVSNLISNAVKYTPRGGHLELELVDDDAQGVRLSVFDTGPGIGEELRGRLFSRFERAKGAAQLAPGAGLGLALSKCLIEAHAGTIDAHPRAAGASGTELRVVLPRELVVRDVLPRMSVRLRLVGEVPRGTGDGGRSATYAPAGASRGTVLLAEDDVRLADLVARLLGEEYTVVVAHDGITALELAREHQPQLLITDIDMPGLDGMELARRFRELAGDRLAPIIILSAMLELGTRLAGLEAGAVDYITKPFDPPELVARVAAQFRARELAVRLHRAEQVSALGILTSGLAHELRNPANAIANAIEPLVQRLPSELVHPEQPVGQLLDVIRECAEQMRALSKQLLGVRGQTTELEVRPAVLRDLVQRAVGLAQIGSGIEVRLDIEAATVRCAPPLLVQALANLVENAAHAAGATGWIAVRATTVGSRLTIEVGDSGPGVPPALRERVFEPFFTTKPDHLGTGLGLALVRDIVRRHQGTIEIRERPAGTAFVIEMPGVCLPMVAADAI